MTARSRPTDPAVRKAQLVAASERARRQLVAALPLARRTGTPEARLLSNAAELLRQPATIGILLAVLVALGPRRVFAAARWAAMTLPLHPLGRRLLSIVGERVADALSGAADRGAR